MMAPCLQNTGAVVEEVAFVRLCKAKRGSSAQVLKGQPHLEFLFILAPAKTFECELPLHWTGPYCLGLDTCILPLKLIKVSAKLGWYKAVGANLFGWFSTN